MTDILDPNYESGLTEEEHDQLVLMSEHAIARPLSPATQAVLDAFRSSHTGPGCLAAALRAVADQVAPDDYDPPREGSYPEAASFVDGKCVRNEGIRYQLLVIANELEGHHA